MFQFRRFSPYTYGFSARWRCMNTAGLPHSEIPGSKDVCSSPRLFAAYHVFHRLPVPRHSPCALYSLTVFSLDWFSICQQEISRCFAIYEVNSRNIACRFIDITAGEIIVFIILLGMIDFSITNLSFRSSIFSFQGTSSMRTSPYGLESFNAFLGYTRLRSYNSGHWMPRA